MSKAQPTAPLVAVINDHGADRLRSGHPWVYSGDILGWEPAPPDAAASTPMRLRDRRGNELGVADYSPHSKITLRLLSPNASRLPDDGFFRERIRAAIAYRKSVIHDSDAYRVISAEADGLPGLIVDRYSDALSFQTLTWAMEARRPFLLQCLEEELTPRVIVERNEASVRKFEGLEQRSGLLRGESALVETRINGLRFEVDLLTGQKTGGFLDQRENWAAVARRAAERKAADALDVFTYQGGFALHLAKTCRVVEAVDSSRPALEAADRNAQLNQRGNIEWIEANAFDLLRDYDRNGKQFDMVVLDPPAFAKTRDARSAAAGGYKEINLRALKLLRPGGMLVSCSCSHHFSESQLLDVVASAAVDARRELTVLERRTQALDHPILLTVPETLYMKCIIAIAR